MPDILQIKNVSKKYSNHVALKSTNGKYLSLDVKSLHIFERADSISATEKFILAVQ